MLDRPLLTERGNVPFADTCLFAENGHTHLRLDDLRPAGLEHQAAIRLADFNDRDDDGRAGKGFIRRVRAFVMWIKAHSENPALAVMTLFGHNHD